jgi:hypothetical protein
MVLSGAQIIFMTLQIILHTDEISIAVIGDRNSQVFFQTLLRCFLSRLFTPLMEFINILLSNSTPWQLLILLSLYNRGTPKLCELSV